VERSVAQNIAQIHREFGSKPFFVYDLDALAFHLEKLQAPGVRFWYATKANPLSSILKVADAAGFGIDCASAGEFRQALRAGVAPAKILITGPSKSPALFQEALDAGISTFVLESITQVQDLEKLAQAKNLKVKGLLRLQISWRGDESNAASVLGGTAVSAFGLDVEGWSKLELASLQSVKIIGVHCFQWGNILSSARLARIWQETLKHAQALSRQLDFPLQVLDLGGGLGIPYHGEAELNFESVQTELHSLKARIPETEIWMELGRYAVGPYGKYVTSIVDCKVVLGKNLLVLEGGVHHLLRPALVKESFPVTFLRRQVEKMPTEIAGAEKTGGAVVSTLDFTLHGPLCTALDELGTFALPSTLAIGDSLVFHQCGAYGFTESMPYFLCHDLPAEFTIFKNELHCIRPWQQPESWLV
jgi:diaminopimelate decarboxylase